MLRDRIAETTAAQFAWSKLNAGNNNLPDWIVNTPVGRTQLGTPYYDSVKFVLDELNKSDEYINTLISVSNSASITRTFINGRKGGSIKQIVGEGDYEIIFNIKITAPFYLNDVAAGTIQKVGNGNPLGGGTSLENLGQFISEPFAIQTGYRAQFQGDYLPNDEMSKLIQFLTKFYQDISYKNIKVNSLYLNDVFGIYNIVPYSINTQQNNESTNTYNIIISAYSDNSGDTDTYSDEIIPK